MKKIKILIMTIIFLLVCNSGFSQAAVATIPGSITLDPSSWLTALDDLYATYDSVANTITQIENQYRQIQQAVERAKSIDWSNIKFDGDFDIRNDIKDANKKVNRLITQARTIRNTLTTANINIGGFQYSLADLAGVGADGKNLITACTDVKNYMTANMKMAVEHLTNELTEEQKMAIWKKYKISPQNYIFVQQSIAQVKEKAGIAIAEASDEARELYYQQKVEETNDVLRAVYETLDSDGNPTAAATQEALVHLSEKIVMGLVDTKTALDKCAGLVANNQIAYEAEKQARADEEKIQNDIDERRAAKTSSRFKIK